MVLEELLSARAKDRFAFQGFGFRVLFNVGPLKNWNRVLIEVCCTLITWVDCINGGSEPLYESLGWFGGIQLSVPAAFPLVG